MESRSCISTNNERGPVPLPPPLIYLAGFGLGLLLELAAPSPDLPTWLRIAAGVVGGALVVALDTGAMANFRKHGTPVNPARPAQALVTAGPYRLTRNPMYLGMACLYAGIALAVATLWPLATLILVLLVMDRVVIPREEAHMTARFGDEYTRYRARVRRWL